MHIYDAVKYALNIDPVTLTIGPGNVSDATVVVAEGNRFVAVTTSSPDTYPPIVQSGAKIPPSSAPSRQFCVCCQNNVAVRGDKCYECNESHDAEVEKLKNVLRRCLPHVTWAHDSYPSTFRRVWMEAAEELIAEIESECGDV